MINQAVVSSTSATARAVLQKYRSRLTAKQIALLENKMRGGKAISIMSRAEVPKRLRTPLLRARIANTNPLVSAYGANGLKVDVRNHPDYNQLYASLGQPPELPLPYPYFRGTVMTSQKYAYAQNGTSTVVVSIPAGASAIVFSNPTDFRRPLRVAYTGAGGDTWATDVWNFDRKSVSTSWLLTDTYTGADWRLGQCPFMAYGDSDCIKNAATGTVYSPDPKRMPPLIQCMGASIHWEVDTPYTGQCVVTVLSPGDSKQRLGHGGSPVVGSSSQLVRYGYGHGFEPVYYQPAYSPAVASSAIDFTKQFGQPVVSMGGSSSAHITGVCRGNPDHGWTMAGMLDVVDDAGGAVSQSFDAYGMCPRFNPSALHQYGWVLIENTGAAAVTLMARSNYTYAVNLQPDDLETNIAQLASLARLEASELKTRTPSTSKLAIGSHVSTDKESLSKEIQGEMVHSGVHPLIAGADNHKIHQPAATTKSKFVHNAEEVGGAVGIADLAARNVGSGESIFARAAQFARTAASKIKSLVGEAGGGARSALSEVVELGELA